MATAEKGMIKSIIWAVVAYVMISLVSANVFLTMVFYYKQGIPAPVLHNYALITVILQTAAIPLLLAVFRRLDSRDKLPDLHIRKENIRSYPALLISFPSVLKGILWWLVLGLLPFLLFIVIMTVILRDHMIVFIPGGSLYMELAFVYILYKKLKVTA